MGFSTALLLVAGIVAFAVLAAGRFRAPRSLREAAVGAGAGALAAVIGALATSAGSRHGIFGLAHLAWLLAVVTLPIVLGCWFVVERTLGEPTMPIRFGGLVALMAALAGIWGTHVEPNLLRVDAEVLPTRAVSAPLRIGVLADLQTPNIGSHEREAIAKLLERSPDLVVVPGDLYQGSPETIAANRLDFVTLLADLVDGVELVVVVSGDADRRALLEPIVRDAGAVYLDNDVVERTVGGVPVRVAGVDVHGRGPERGAVLSSLSEPSERLTILVAHRPDVVYELPAAADVDLITAGHTHGGQVALPFFGPLITFSDVPRSLAGGGLETIEGFPVYVSTGVGLERRSAPQVRLGVRPSVGIIDVVPV